MLSTFVSCAAIVAVSASASLPEAKPDTTTAKPAATTTKPAAAKQAATATAKSQPQTHTVNRPVSEPTKSAPAAAKAEKFEILAIEQSIVDSTNAQRAAVRTSSFGHRSEPDDHRPAARQLDGLVSPVLPFQYRRGGEHSHGPVQHPGSAWHMDEFVRPSGEYP